MHVFGRWEEAGVPERTHAYTGRTCRLHTERPQPGWTWNPLLWGDGADHHTTVQPIFKSNKSNKSFMKEKFYTLISVVSDTKCLHICFDFCFIISFDAYMEIFVIAWIYFSFIQNTQVKIAVLPTVFLKLFMIKKGLYKYKYLFSSQTSVILSHCQIICLCNKYSPEQFHPCK